MATALVALKIDGPGPLILVLALVAGAAGGAIWAGISALLRYWRGVEVVISSLLLVFVAYQLLSYALSTTALLHETGPEGASLTESNPLPAGTRLPRFGTYPNANMSPAALDPDGFLAQFGQRPFAHLEELGVLGPDVVAVHCVHVDDDEVALLGRHGCSVAHCPTTALKVSYGVTQIGKMPEMVRAGVNLAIGTDGNNASNYSDLMSTGRSPIVLISGCSTAR